MKKAGNDALSDAQIKMYKRAKNLVNVGEVSKAMSTILSNGVAKVDSEVLSQLKAKHPPRPSVVRLPSKEQIESDRANWERESQAAVEDMVESKVDIDMPSEQPVNQGANEGMSVNELSSFPNLFINAEQILAAAKKKQNV